MARNLSGEIDPAKPIPQIMDYFVAKGEVNRVEIRLELLRQAERRRIDVELGTLPRGESPKPRSQHHSDSGIPGRNKSIRPLPRSELLASGSNGESQLLASHTRSTEHIWAKDQENSSRLQASPTFVEKS